MFEQSFNSELLLILLHSRNMLCYSLYYADYLRHPANTWEFTAEGTNFQSCALPVSNYVHQFTKSPECFIVHRTKNRFQMSSYCNKTPGNGQPKLTLGNILNISKVFYNESVYSLCNALEVKTSLPLQSVSIEFGIIIGI